jgi:hypothetical protein
MIFFQSAPATNALADPNPPPILLIDKAVHLHAKSLPKIIHMPGQNYGTEKSTVSKQESPEKKEKQRK